MLITFGARLFLGVLGCNLLAKKMSNNQLEKKGAAGCVIHSHYLKIAFSVPSAGLAPLLLRQAANCSSPSVYCCGHSLFDSQPASSPCEFGIVINNSTSSQYQIITETLSGYM